MSRRSHLWGVALVLLLALAAAAAPGPAAAAPIPQSAAQRLADAYAPILMLRKQDDPPCDTSAEQYQPTDVGAMLGNPEVELEGPKASGKGQYVIKKAPSAADIAPLDGGYHLNVPGDPVGDTCVYARDFEKLKREGKAPAITYAHIARERGYDGLVLQYWFFYYFNQFNDVHEGDWEGMQIAFHGNTPGAALSQGPYEIALFQHSGGERAGWGDSKVQKRGTHPIVYPAAGSHATFYDDAVYIENGQNGSGVGCDNTSRPLRRLPVRPVLIPTHPAIGGRFQWLDFTGHWGQLESGYNNGPTGPSTKTVWRQPFSWMAGIRQASPRLPDAIAVGPAITSAFCGAVAGVSGFINLQSRTDLGATLIVIALILLLTLPALFTRWRPVDLERLRVPRAFGQLVRAARQFYGRHWRALVPIGLTAFLIVGAVDALIRVIGISDRDISLTVGGLHLHFGSSLTGMGRELGFAVVAAAAISCVVLAERGEPAGFLASYRAMLARFWRLVAGQLLATIGVALLTLTVIGIPWAVYKFVGWQFVQQQILFEDRSLREAFRGSSRVVKGHWWRTVRVAGFFWLISVVTGPLLVFALVFTTLSPTVIDLLGSLVYALLVPYVAVGRTLLYFDLEAREAGMEIETVPRLRDRLRSRAEPSPAN